MSSVFKATIENKTTSVTTHFKEINKERNLNINTAHVKILKMQVCYTNRNIIMNFVGNGRESEPLKSFFLILCSRERRGVQRVIP